MFQLHLDLVQVFELASPASCKTLATFIDFYLPKQPPPKRKQRNLKKNQPSNNLYHIALAYIHRTQS